jgi:pentapeptide MXKDX repeat protein
MKLAFLTPALALGVTILLSGAPASAQDQHHGTTHGSTTHGSAMHGSAMHGSAMHGSAMHGSAMHGNAMRGGAMHMAGRSRPSGYTNYSYGGVYNGYRPGYYGNGWAYTGGVHYWHHHHAYWRNGVWGYLGPSGIFITIPL